MQTSDALKILQALADGADPQTGEIFPENSPYQHPQVVRALMVAIRALEQQRENPTRNRRLPENAGKAWKAEEESELCRGFDEGTPIKELAARHKRTQGAIVTRLVALGKIQPPEGLPSASSKSW